MPSDSVTLASGKQSEQLLQGFVRLGLVLDLEREEARGP